jgi:hypothetical protein
MDYYLIHVCVRQAHADHPSTSLWNLVKREMRNEKQDRYPRLSGDPGPARHTPTTPKKSQEGQKPLEKSGTGVRSDADTRLI